MIKPISITLTFILILSTQNVNSQVAKCKDSSGRIIYSDTICNGNQTRQNVYTADVNVLNSDNGPQQNENEVNSEYKNSGRQPSKYKIDNEVSNLMENPPIECKFSYFTINDDKGHVLAANAKKECVRNIVAKKYGLQTSKEEYGMWKDHFDQLNARRGRSKSMTCIGIGIGGGITTCN